MKFSKIGKTLKLALSIGKINRRLWRFYLNYSKVCVRFAEGEKNEISANPFY